MLWASMVLAAGEARVELRPGLPEPALGWAAFVQARLDASSEPTPMRVELRPGPPPVGDEAASVEVTVRARDTVVAERRFAADSTTGALDVWFFVRSSLERWRADPAGRAAGDRLEAEPEARPRREIPPGRLFGLATVRPDPEVGGRLGGELPILDRVRLGLEAGYAYAHRPDQLDRHRVPVIVRGGWRALAGSRLSLQLGLHHHVDLVIAQRGARGALDVSLGAGLFATLRSFFGRRAFLQLTISGTGYHRRQAFETDAGSDREPAGVFEAALGIGWAP